MRSDPPEFSPGMKSRQTYVSRVNVRLPTVTCSGAERSVSKGIEGTVGPGQAVLRKKMAATAKPVVNAFMTPDLAPNQYTRNGQAACQASNTLKTWVDLDLQLSYVISFGNKFSGTMEGEAAVRPPPPLFLRPGRGIISKE
jgi:hypothetical protein